jgi:hypothetical protein
MATLRACTETAATATSRTTAAVGSFETGGGIDLGMRRSSRAGLHKAVRCGAASGLLGQDQPASVEPRRGPHREQCASADRLGQDEF